MALKMRFKSAPDMFGLLRIGRQGLGVYSALSQERTMIIHKRTYSCAGWTPQQWELSLPRISNELRYHIASTGAQAIVVRGSSGLLYAGRILEKIDVPFIMVRKPNELSHGCPVQVISGHEDVEVTKYIFLDDLVASGSTEKAVEDAMVGAYRVMTVCYQNTDKPHGERTYSSDRVKFS